MEQRVVEVFRVGVVGPPVGQKQIGLAMTDRLSGTRCVPLDDLGPNSNGGEVLLDRLGQTSQLRTLRAPEFQGEAVGVSGLLEQTLGFGWIVGVGCAGGVVTGNSRWEGAGRTD